MKTHIGIEEKKWKHCRHLVCGKEETGALLAGGGCGNFYCLQQGTSKREESQSVGLTVSQSANQSGKQSVRQSVRQAGRHTGRLKLFLVSAYIYK